MAGAMFLMATSAIGPGFLTQTSVFTVQMGASFAFAIALSILVDIAIQLNVWRVLCVTGMRANTLGNTVLPGLGWVLAGFVFFGGAIFNIGNIAGAGLGLNAMLGIDARIGGGIRSVSHVSSWLERGVSRVILGTVAVKDPDTVKAACAAFPGQVAVGIDAGTAQPFAQQKMM